MFKIFNISFHNIPGFVWGFLVAALLFFGVLYMVPEAGQFAAKAFSTPARPASEATPPPFGLPNGAFDRLDTALDECIVSYNVRTIKKHGYTWYECIVTIPSRRENR
jgi:hypothetical protein